MKKIILNVCFVVLAVGSFAQEKSERRTERDAKKEERRQKIDNLIRQQEEGALIYNKQSVFGIRLNTDGLGLMYEKMGDPKRASKKYQNASQMEPIGDLNKDVMYDKIDEMNTLAKKTK